MAAIPSMNSSGSALFRSISFSQCSHSAVRSGDCSCSGRTVIKDTAVWVGINCTAFLDFFLSTKPADTSFSRIAARVAGVPSPLRSASSGISFAPAVSIAASKLSSVKCLGGLVFPSLMPGTNTSKCCPFSTIGSDLASVSSSFSGVRFIVSRKFISYCFQPVLRTARPFAVNLLSAQLKTTVVSEYS